MRGHGNTVVADTLQKAVYRAVCTEANLSERESLATRQSVERQAGRAWDLCKQLALAQ